MRYLLLLYLAMLVVPVAAQENSPSWCPVRDAVVEEMNPPTQLVDVELTDFGITVTGQLSSDGERIAYTRLLRDVPVELWVANTDGTDPRVLLYIDDLVNMRDDGPQIVPGIHRYQWIPDTHQLMMQTGQYPISEEGIFAFTPDDLWLVDTNTGESSVLLPQGEGGRFALSPDGQFVVVETREELLIMESDGENRHEDLLPEYIAPGVGPAPYFPPIIWQDSESFLTVTASDPYSPDAEVTIWQVSTSGDTQAVRTITAAFLSVAFSPDGVFIAYWNTPAEPSNQRRLYISQTYGDEEFLFLEHERFEFAGWLPDARHFLYFENINASATLGDVCGGSDPAPYEIDSPENSLSRGEPMCSP